MDSELTSNMLETWDKALDTKPAKLHKEEQRGPEKAPQMNAMLEAFDGFIYLCSQDYRIEYMNAKLINWTGYDATGEQCFKAIHDRDTICPWCENDQVFKGKTIRLEIQSPKDNRWYHVVNILVHHLDGSKSKQAMITDITERKNAEEALRKNEARLLQIVNGNPIPTFVIDDNHIITHWNKACEKLTGLPADKMIGTNRQWTPFYKQERPAMADLLVNMAAESEIASYYPDKFCHSKNNAGAYEAENFFPHFGESGKWLFFTAAPLQDTEGRIIGAVETLQDITERKHTENYLANSHQEWSVAMDASDDAIYLLDTNRHILRANKAFFLMTGSSPEKAIGSYITNIVHPEGETVPCSVCLAQEDKRDAVIIMEPDQPDNPTGRPIEITVKIVKDHQGQPLSILMRLHDLTAQRKIETELRKSKIEWEKTFNSITDVVSLLDTSMRIVKVNQAGCDTLGLSCEAITGHYCYELFHGSNEPCPDCPLLVTKKTFEPYTKEITHKKLGKTFLVSASPVMNEQGQLVQVAHVAKDVTEIKKIEERLFLNEKLATIAGLAAGVAHEINTPLSAILQSQQIIEMRLDPDKPRNQKRAAECGVDLSKVDTYFKYNEIDSFMKGMRSSAITAGNIIKNLLEFSRPHKGEIKNANLASLLDTSLELARADYDLKKQYDIINVKIVKEYDADLTDVPCVAMEFEQVILNLIKNAVHAMADNKTEAQCITIRTAKKEKMARIEVEDNGPGIDEKTRLHIFDPFFTTKEIGQGTGLGLSVSHAIVVDKHRGRLWVESEKGHGAKFIVELPLKMNF